ncbi:MAG: carboxypeptidase regulatory-like domain-containing protein [Phycisphaerae bacterium]|nr:carboxypeptidase regulatory-like domain-containing protein [Phycisphaerae bacterium]
MTLRLGWNGQKVFIPGPLYWSTEGRRTNDYQNWQRYGDIRTLQFTDSHGRQWQTKTLGLNMPQITVHRPDGTLLATGMVMENNRPSHWELYDATGKNKIFKAIYRQTKTKQEKDTGLWYLAYFYTYDPDGTEHEWQVNGHGVVRGENVTLPNGRGYYAAYARPYEDFPGKAYSSELCLASELSNIRTAANFMLVNAQAGDVEVAGRLVQPDSPLAKRMPELPSLLKGKQFSLPGDKVTIDADRATLIAERKNGEKTESWTLHMAQTDDGHWLATNIDEKLKEVAAFFILGNVKRPGAYTMTNRDVTVKMAIASAGIATGKNRPTKAILIRRAKGNQEESFSVDLEGILTGKVSDFFLKPHDILAVGVNSDFTRKQMPIRSTLKKSIKDSPAEKSSPAGENGNLVTRVYDLHSLLAPIPVDGGPALPEMIRTLKHIDGKRNPAGKNLKSAVKVEKMDENGMVTREYDIRDLMAVIPQIENSPAASDPWDDAADGTFQQIYKEQDPKELEKTRSEMRKVLLQTFQTSYSEKGWSPKPGGGKAEIQKGNLIVTQTPECHKNIQKLLKRLRSMRGLRIRTETRFITFPKDVGEKMQAWLRNQNLNDKKTAKKSIRGIFLTPMQADALLKETQKYKSANTLTAPAVTTFNGQRAYVSAAKNQAVLFSQPGTEEKVVEYFREGTVLDIDATLSQDRKYVTMNLKPIHTNLVSADKEVTYDMGSLDMTVSLPDEGTLLMFIPSQRWQAQGVKPITGPDGKTTHEVISQKIPGATEQLWLMVKPKIILHEDEPPSQTPNQTDSTLQEVAKLRDRKVTAELDLADARLRFGSKHKNVTQLEERLADIQKLIDQYEKPKKPVDRDSEIRIGDVLRIDVQNLYYEGVETTLQREVSRTGKIDLPLLPERFVAAGQTTDELREQIRKAYQKTVMKEKPQVEVTLILPKLANSPELQILRDRKLEFELELLEAQRRFGSKHKNVIQLEGRLADVRKLITQYEKPKKPANRDREIRIGDVLAIRVQDLYYEGVETTLQREVSQTGQIDLPLLDKKIVALGVTAYELRERISNAYHKTVVLRKPKVEVRLLVSKLEYSPELQKLRAKKVDVELELMEAQRTYGPNHKNTLRFQSQLDAVNELLAKDRKSKNDHPKGKVNSSASKKTTPAMQIWQGTIVDETNRAVPGATVAAYQATGNRQNPVKIVGKVTSDERGNFTMSLPADARPGRYSGVGYGQFVAFKDGKALDWHEPSIHPDKTEFLSFTLGDSRTLSGTVVNEKGRPIADAVVRACLNQGRGNYIQPPIDPMGNLTTKTDAKGRFQFHGIPASAGAEFEIHANGYACVQTRGSLSDDYQYSAGQDNIRIALPRAAKMKGRVIDKTTGKGVSNVYVNAHSHTKTFLGHHNGGMTDKDGRFVIVNALPGKTSLNVWPPSFNAWEWIMTQPVNLQTQAGRKEKDITIEVQHGLPVKITVTDEKDHPISGASIRITSKGKNKYCPNTNADGVARAYLLPGEYQINGVGCDGYLARKLEMSFVLKENQTKNFTVQLFKMPGITGIVRDSQGKPVQGAAVRLVGGSRMVTGPDGRFELFDRSDNPGSGGKKNTILVRHEARNLVAVTPLLADKRYCEITLTPGFMMRGRVISSDKKPLPHAQVRIQMEFTESSNSYTIATLDSTVTNAEGQYEFLTIPAGRKYEITAEAAGYIEDKLTEQVPEDQTGILHPRTLQLRPATMTVSGVVLDRDGKPIPNAIVYASNNRYYGAGNQFRTDKQGRFTATELGGGQVNISVTVEKDGRRMHGSTTTTAGSKDVVLRINQQ